MQRQPIEKIKPLPTRVRWQRRLGCRTVVSSPEKRLGFARCEQAAQTSQGDNAPVVHATGAQVRELDKQRGHAPLAPPRVADRADACMPVDDADDSNHAKAQEQNRRAMDARARSPGAASPWRYPAIGTARVQDKGGSCGCWRHTPRVSSHRLLCVARGQSATGRRGNAVCRLAGRESLDPRSDQLSRGEPDGAVHIPVQGKSRGSAALAHRGGPEQTRWYAQAREPADGRAPGADSTPIEQRFATSLDRSQHDYTSDRDPTPGLRRPEHV